MDVAGRPTGPLARLTGVSAEQLHATLLVLLHPGFAAVATTAAWTEAVTAGRILPRSDLGTSATQGRTVFGG